MSKRNWRRSATCSASIPMTDLHSITIYGTQLKKDTGVAIIHAKVDQKLLLDMVKTNAGTRGDHVRQVRVAQLAQGRRRSTTTPRSSSPT